MRKNLEETFGLIKITSLENQLKERKMLTQELNEKLSNIYKIIEVQKHKEDRDR